MPTFDDPAPCSIGQPQFSHRYIDRNLEMWHCVRNLATYDQGH
jgi:hypothetical protein